MSKQNNLKDYLTDLYDGISSKKPDASRNPQNFRAEIEAIKTGGIPWDGDYTIEGEALSDPPIAYHLTSADDLPEDAPDGSLAVVEDSDSIVGTWLFNEEIPREGMPTHGFKMASYYYYPVQCSKKDDIITNYIALANFEEYGITEGLWFGLTAELSTNSFDILYDTTDFDGNDYGWQGEDERELTIIRCDDEIVANWIKSNARKLSNGYTLYVRENGKWVIKGENSGGSGGGESIVGTWVFNEEITTFLHDVDTQEEYDNGEYSQEYPLCGYYIFDGEKCFFNTIYCYRVKGELEGSDFDNSEIGFDNGGVMYEDGLFYFNSFTITKEPSAAVANWIRANAKKQVVESDSLVGEWKFNETLTPINKPFEEGWEDIKVPFTATAYRDDFDAYYVFYYDTITLVGDSNFMEEVAFANYANNEFSCMEATYYTADEGWTNNAQIPVIVNFLEDKNDAVFKEWLSRNATKLRGGHTLYARANGEG